MYLIRPGFLFSQLYELLSENCTRLLIASLRCLLDLHLDLLLVAFQLPPITFYIAVHFSKLLLVSAESF